MVAAYRSHTTANSGSGGYNISRPSGVTSGDVLVLAVFTDTGNATDIGTPSGWTLAASQNSGQDYTRGRVFVKTAGSEPSSYSLSHNGSSSVAILVAVQDATLPGVYAAVSSGSGNNVTSPSVTPSSASGIEIRFAGADGDGSNRTFTPPSTYTEFADLRNQSFTHAQGVYKVLSSASATGNQNHLASGSIVSRLGFTVFVPSAVTSVDATAEPATVQASTSIPSPAVAADYGSTATPATVAAAATIAQPGVSTPGINPEIRDVTQTADRLTALTAAAPTMQAGDLLVAFHVCDLGTLADMSVGGDWQILDEHSAGEDQLQTRLYWKVADGDEPASWTFEQADNSDGSVLIVSISGTSGDEPAVELTGGQSGLTVTTPGITPPAANSLELRFAGGVPFGAEPRTWTAPAGLDEIADIQSTDYTTATAASRELSSTSPTGTETFTPSGALDVSVGVTLGIAPGAAPSGATATPSAVQATTSIPAPTVQAETSATATPETVTATASIPAPTVSTPTPGGDPAAYRSHSTASDTDDTSYTIDRPAGTTEGDILVLAQFQDVGEPADIGDPDGWTLLAAQASTEDFTRGKLFIKQATSSEPATYTLTHGLAGLPGVAGVAILICVENAELPAVWAASTAGSGASISTPSVTPSSANGIEVRFAAADGGGTGQTITPPAGYTEPPGADLNEVGFIHLAAAYKQLSSPSATGVLDFVASGPMEGYVGFTVWLPGGAATGGDATATPAVVEVAASVPSPSAGAGSTASPTVVEASASVPAPAVALGATVAPASVQVSATVPPAAVSSGSSAAPAVVQGSVSVPSPTVRAGSAASPATVQAGTSIPSPSPTTGSTAPAATVHGSASIPAVQPSAGATATPSTVSATAEIPAPGVTAVTTASPGTVHAATAIPAPEASASATAAPNVVESTISIPAPTLSTGATASTGVVSATTTIPTPEASAGSTASPSTVQAPATVPAPTTATGSTAAPGTVEASAAIPSPSVATGLVAQPGTVHASASIPTPEVAFGQTAAPATVAASASIPAPAVQSGSSSTAPTATVEATAAIPGPSVSAGSTAQAAVVAADATIPAPGVSVGSTASPGVVEALASIPGPSVAADSTATPETVQATAAIPAPTVEADGNATAQPGVVRAAASTPTPNVGVSSTATPAVVLATAAVPTPTATVLVAATPQVVEAYATIPAALVHTTARPPTVRAVATIPTPAVSTGDLPQQIDIKVGPPTRWWSAGNPGRTWQAGEPSRRWSAGAPTR